MEILAVQDSFSNADPDERSQSLRKDKATEQRVRDLAPTCRYMHFATHGYFADGRLRSTTAAESRADVRNLHPGLLSGLVLAGANQPVDPQQDDGILTALEVQELDLSGMELATLSACQTGLGKSIGGEGALGLQRAFQIAGARTVVASLWLVEDRAGRQLMTDFYENLWQKKLSKIEALRQAQLSMLEEGIRGMVAEDDDGKPKTSHRLSPYYWGMFVLSGDWRLKSTGQGWTKASNAAALGSHHPQNRTIRACERVSFIGHQSGRLSAVVAAGLRPAFAVAPAWQMLRRRRAFPRPAGHEGVRNPAAADNTPAEQTWPLGRRRNQALLVGCTTLSITCPRRGIWPGRPTTWP